ncbi:MAG TPA: hypothetical protein VF902_04950 [Coriobacteriia bacterium]
MRQSKALKALCAAVTLLVALTVSGCSSGPKKDVPVLLDAQTPAAGARNAADALNGYSAQEEQQIQDIQNGTTSP